MSKIKVNRLENTATADGGIDIDSSGDVGIGTSSPQSLLSVKVSASRQLDVIKDSGDDHLVLKSTAPDASYNLRSIELAGEKVAFSTGASSGTAYTERMRIDSSGTTTFTGAVTSTTTAKAWLNFNGTGTVAIRASYNVSSITDNGTGSYTVNFTTAMTDANYVCVVNAADVSDVSNLNPPAGVDRLASSVRIDVETKNPSQHDAAQIDVAIFR